MIHADPSGTYTIKQVLRITYSVVPDRFSGKEEDEARIQHIDFKEVKYFDRSVGGGGEPKIKYQFVSYMKPKYRKVKYAGQTKVFNKKVESSYQIIFETDKLSINTTHWKVRLGTGVVWWKAPKKQLFTIHKDDRNQYASLEEAKGIKFKRNMMFENEGDWNSGVQGLNADFIFRCSYVYQKYGHLYGITEGLPAFLPPVKTNPKQVMFFPKHLVNFFRILIERGILLDDQRK